MNVAMSRWTFAHYKLLKLNQILTTTKSTTLSMKISDQQHFESSGGHYFLDHFN